MAANLKISQLNAAETLTGAELIECVQDGANVQTTAEALAALSGGGERRYAFAEPYIYLGTAPAGTAAAATTWTLTRLTVDAEGVVTATESATDAWDNRVTAIYS